MSQTVNRLDSALQKRLVDELESVCRSIHNEFAPAEKAFLEVGEILQTLTVEAESLSSDAAQAESEASTSLKLTTLPEIAKVSGALFEELGEDNECVAESLTALGSISSALAKLHHSTGFLNAVAKRLNNIRIYISIESSRSSATVTSFASFTDEMHKLSELVLQTCSALSVDEQNARAVQDRQYQEISSGLLEINRLAESANHTVRKTHENVEALLEQASDSLVQVSLHSETVGSAVNEMVVALQSQDIVRQQLEHVAEGINETVEHIQHAQNDDGRLNQGAANLRLLEEHVRDSIAIIRHAHSSIMREFVRAQLEVEELVKSLPRICASESGGSEKSPFEQLIDNAEVLVQLHDRATALEARTAESAGGAAETSTILAKHTESVRLISDEMELRAFNAAIKSARLGNDGRTLKVLSDEVTQLSIRSADFVDTTVQSLGEITTACGAMAESVSRRSNSGNEITGLQDLIESVRTTFQRLRGVCESISKRASMLPGKVAACEADIRFLETYAQHLEDVAKQINNAWAQLEPYVSNNAGHLSLGKVGFQAQYTMERERETYRRVSNGGQATKGTSEKAVEVGGCILF